MLLRNVLWCGIFNWKWQADEFLASILAKLGGALSDDLGLLAHPFRDHRCVAWVPRVGW